MSTNRNIFKKKAAAGLMGLLLPLSTVFVASCNPEPDDSDLYTFTGETIESLILQDSTLTSFNYVLSRVGYDKMMAAYGSYTCFAPTNDGIAYYCDSLYNDPEAVIPHNGMTENSLEGLTDSLCLNLSQFHITTTYRDIVSMTGDGEISTMLGDEFHYSSASGNTQLGENGTATATIVSSDIAATNGLLHVIDRVIPRNDRYISVIFDRNADRYSIFAEALEMTGLVDSLMQTSKGVFEFKQLRRANYSDALSPASGPGTTGSAECKVGYTVFAETDDVLRANGIDDIQGLIAYANREYGNAPDWYDYMNENGLTVSTGSDYTNRFNALNMFVAYHIIKASMSVNQLLYEKGSNPYWNYAPDAGPYDYYETMLPHTMMKVWEPAIGTGTTIYINRYRMNNTLTDQLASQGSEDMHEVIEPGVIVNRNGSMQARNGYIHSISKPLVYNRMVPKGVLNERMRVNCTSLFPELITNRYRYWYTGDGNIPSTHDGSRRGIPLKYFDNAVFYTDEEMCFAYCLHGAWRSFESDQMQFWGAYDWGFRLPSVPTGVYEIRVVYAPMDYGSFMQYYLGTSKDVTSMQALGLPFDATVTVEDPRIGMTNAQEEDDMGVASDIAMHNRGYMRGPYSYCGHAESTGWTPLNNGRFEYGASMTVRFILGRVQLNQGTENWLRVKTLNPDNREAPVGLDFVELCPVSVLDNQQYTEDWY